MGVSDLLNSKKDDMDLYVPNGRNEELEVKIVEEINEALKGRDIKEDRMHASSIGFCLLKQYFERLTGRRHPLNGDMVGGTAFHSWFQENLSDKIPKFEDADFEIPVEREIDSEYGKFVICGRADCLTKDNEVFEFKYTSSRPDNPQGSVKCYHLQATIYGILLDADKVNLVLISKGRNIDKEGVCIMSGTPQEKVFDTAVERGKKVFRAIKEIKENEERVKKFKGNRKKLARAVTPDWSGETPTFRWECTRCLFYKEKICYRGLEVKSDV